MPIKIRKRQPYTYYLNKSRLATKLVHFVRGVYFKLWALKYDLDNPPLFKAIDFETFNRCNLGCSFCPANRFADIRSPRFMDFKLFSKIIDDLKELNYKDKIYLFLNNEPLLDKRLENFIAEVSQKLPEAYLSIWTNGTLLTLQRLESLYNAGLRNLLIDNYNDKLEMLPEIKKVLEETKNTKPHIIRNMEIFVWLRYAQAILSNRSGLAPNKQLKETKLIQMHGCFYPFWQLNVNAEGKAFICCNDTYYRNKTGDLNTQTPIEVWRGEDFTNIRKNLIESGRENLLPCKECDVLT